MTPHVLLEYLQKDIHIILSVDLESLKEEKVKLDGVSLILLYHLHSTCWRIASNWILVPAPIEGHR